ncbi:MAG: alpha/beta fold hydrolase, partial [Bacteroidota bacterium]
MKKKVVTAIITIASLYLVICILLFLFQEKLLFFPERLPEDFKFSFPMSFEEINYQVADGVKINTVLFHAAKGEKVVMYLHGNGGSIYGWGTGAETYLRNGYDVLYIDYRGYGKSGGKIESEKQLIADAQLIYDDLKAKYSESNITLIGTSIGSGIAVQIAASNNPERLILNAPYASLKQLIREKVPIVPGVILKYRLESKKYIKEVECPIYIFHGKNDEVIPYRHAVSLKETDDRVQLTLID